MSTTKQIALQPGYFREKYGFKPDDKAAIKELRRRILCKIEYFDNRPIIRK